MGKKRQDRLKNPERHYGYMTLRQSKYPIEVAVGGTTVYLNPLKRLIKNKPYKNLAYQEELNRLVREHALKAAANVKSEEVSNA